MKKKHIILVTICLLLTFLLLSVQNAFALDATSSKGKANLIVYKAPSEISTNSTLYGTIGSATIEWTNQYQVYWRLNAYKASDWINFSGTVTIQQFTDRYSWRTVKTSSVSDSGSGTVSGTVSVSSLSRGTYQASLSGNGICGFTTFFIGPATSSISF